MPKRKTSRKRLSAADRSRILAEANVNNWTAEQIAKRFGVSKWTVYGWRKRKGGGAGRREVQSLTRWSTASVTRHRDRPP